MRHRLAHPARIPAQRRTTVVNRADEYEWRTFVDTAHLYRRVQLAAVWPPMLLPWCEQVRPWPLGHERQSIGGRRLSPRELANVTRCEVCGHEQRRAHMNARQRETAS